MIKILNDIRRPGSCFVTACFINSRIVYFKRRIPFWNMFGYSTKKQIASSAAIAIICLVGDKNSAPVKDADLVAAVCDNVTHAFVGMIVWGSVLVLKSNTTGYGLYFEMLVCAICSSLIDVDHFIMAKSFSLKEATSLRHRPILHCTSGALLLISITLTFAIKFGSDSLYKLGWILAAAFLSHHIRDGTRRGFWMWPFGSTKPLPYTLYITAEVLLPYLIIFCQSKIDFPVSYEPHSVLNV